MKIEVGKSYRTREGKKVTVLRNDESIMPWETSDGTWRYVDGTRHGVADGCAYDLVAEWTEPDTPDADGWIEWKGGECPVDADSVVRYRMRDVSPFRCDSEEVEAGELRWHWAELPSDIIAYRLAQPSKELPVTMEEDSLDATLDERGKRYGKFKDHARISQSLKDAIECEAGWMRLGFDQREALQMISHKIARILNGDPAYADSWVDIAGYAKLVADRLQGVER